VSHGPQRSDSNVNDVGEEDRGMLSEPSGPSNKMPGSIGDSDRPSSLSANDDVAMSSAPEHEGVKLPNVGEFVIVLNRGQIPTWQLGQVSGVEDLAGLVEVHFYGTNEPRCKRPRYLPSWFDTKLSERVHTRFTARRSLHYEAVKWQVSIDDVFLIFPKLDQDRLPLDTAAKLYQLQAQQKTDNSRLPKNP
jgi:hypothetical protein